MCKKLNDENCKLLFDIHTSVVSKWKNIMVKNIEKVFEDNKSKDVNQKKNMKNKLMSFIKK